MTSAPALEYEAARPARLYYGWVALAVAAMAMVATLPGRTQGLGLVTLPLMRDLHLDEIAFGKINLWATLIGAAFCLPCGALIDRYGSRVVLAAIVGSLGLVVLVMSRVQGVGALFVAVTLTRGFGQSALSVVSLAIVGKWFVSRLPKAMGVYAVLVGIGFILAFPGVQYAVASVGWRSVWFWMGVIFLVVITPIGFLLLRDSPERMNLPPDTGDAPAWGTSPVATVSATLGQALRSPMFWALAIASAAYNFTISGIMLFNEPILKDLGLAASFRTLLVIMTLTGLVANFVGGWLAQTWKVQHLMAIAMLVMAIALFAFPAAHTPGHVMVYALAMGVSGGIVTVVFFACWGRLFGRAELGRIQGAAQLLTVVGSAIGQEMIAQSRSATGSYHAFFRAMAVASGLLGIVCLLVRETRPRSATGFPLDS